MSSEQITQETVPVEKTETSTETVKPSTQETKQEATTSTAHNQLGKILLVKFIETILI